MEWANTSRDIAEEFCAYYSKLYNIRKGSGRNERDKEVKEKGDINRYLQESGLPRLQEEAICKMEEPITVQEFNQALSEFQNGKAPGPDGFLPRYYWAFRSILAPQFITAFNSIREEGKISAGLQKFWRTGWSRVSLAKYTLTKWALCLLERHGIIRREHWDWSMKQAG